LSINGIAHITGGGITENLPRVLPEHVQARIKLESWQRPIIFDWLQEQGNILSTEMYRTFNCGIGMVLCLSPKDSEQALYLLKEAHHEAAIIGEIVEKKPNQEAVVFI
jgi:phosphoribosylformylglycinamidine cyclo-ligase